MGEEEKKPEEKKMEEKKPEAAEGKKVEEEKKEEKKGEEKKEEKKEEGKEKTPPPPQEIILKVYMHCEGCARKVRRCLKGFEGVENVITDCKSSKVIVKGEKADPLKVLERVQRKSHRQVDLLSPIPKPPSEDEKKPKPEKDKPKPEEKKEVPQIVTVVLKVYMHCEACAQEIKKRILRMKGVESAEADLKSSQVLVKGALDPAELVEYVYKRTGKHAVIVKQDPAPPDNTNTKKDKEESKGGEGEVAKDEKKAEEKGDDKKKGDGAASEEANKDTKKDGEATEPENNNNNVNKDVNVVGEDNKVVDNVVELKRNEFNYYPPRYAMELYAYNAYPPQIFSDENPNACSIM